MLAQKKQEYQLKKLEQEIDKEKRKAKNAQEEFQALQQSVTNRQKMLQQKINRLEQEVLELKSVRDVLTKDYKNSLVDIINLTKADSDGKVQLLGQSLERMNGDLAELRKQVDESKERNRDFEEKLTKAMTDLDLAKAETNAVKRAKEETEAASEVLKAKLKEGGANGSSSTSSKFALSFRDKACLVFGHTTFAKELCLALNECGARVVVMSKDEKMGEEVVKRISDVGGTAVFQKYEGDAKSFHREAKKVCETWGTSYDAVFNVFSGTQLCKESSEFDRALQDVVKVCHDVSKAEISLIKGKGRLLNVIEEEGLFGEFLVSLTRSLDSEKVRCNTLTNTKDNSIGAALFLCSEFNGSSVHLK